MNKQIEALKMAIEALDNACMKIEKWTKGGKWNAGKDALNACKEALVESEENNLTRDWKNTIDERIAKDNDFSKALAEAEKQEHWLTRDKLADILDEVAEAIRTNNSEGVYHLAHRIKNGG
jgi:hypothetical protein